MKWKDKIITKYFKILSSRIILFNIRHKCQLLEALQKFSLKLFRFMKLINLPSHYLLSRMRSFYWLICINKIKTITISCLNCRGQKMYDYFYRLYLLLQKIFLSTGHLAKHNGLLVLSKPMSLILFEGLTLPFPFLLSGDYKTSMTKAK